MVKRLVAWYKRPNKSWLSQNVESFLFIALVAFFIRTFFFGLYQVPTGSMETTMLVGERFFADKLTPWFIPIKRGEVIAFNDPKFVYSDNPMMNLWQRYVWGPSNFTKRVIGIPGDHVQGVIEDGKPVIYVNGQKLNEPYLNKYPLIPPSIEKYPRSWDASRPYDDQPFYNMNEAEVKFAQRIYELHGRRPIRMPGTLIEENQDPSVGVHQDVFDVHLGPNQYWVMGDNRLGSGDSRDFGPLDGKQIHARIKLLLFSVDTDEGWLILDIIKNPISFWKKVRWSRTLNIIR